MLTAETKVVKHLLQNKRYEMKGLVMEYKQALGELATCFVLVKHWRCGTLGGTSGIRCALPSGQEWSRDM